MAYEWDDAKSESNRRKHGFGFEIIEGVDWDLALCFDIQTVDHEERQVWIGPIGDLLHTVVIAERGDTIRILALRVATKPEIANWRREFQNG